MKPRFRAIQWIRIGSLVGLLLASCQIGSLSFSDLTSSGKETELAADVNATLTANAETEAARPSPTPPPPTDTPIPSNTPTRLSPPTLPPTARPVATRIQATKKPELSNVTIVNNLNAVIYLTLNGPIIKSFSVQAHSSYTFQAPAGGYSYTFKANNFYPDTGWMNVTPGEYTFTFGKAK